MMIDQPETNETVSEETANSNEDQESLVEEKETSEEVSLEASASEDDGTSKEEEWVVPGRFRTVEDLKRSYQYLEADYTRKGGEVHNLKRQLETKKVDQSQETERFAEAVKRNPVEAVRDIAREVAQAGLEEAKKVRFEAEYHRLKQNKDFVDHEPVMSQIAQEYGDMIQDNGWGNDPRLLHILFDAARGRQQVQIAQQAEARGRQKGEKAAVKKTRAQVESVSGTKGPSQRKFENLSAEEMRKELLKGNFK